MLEAVRAGVVIGYLGQIQVADELARGRRVALPGDWIPGYPGLCLECRRRRNVPTRLRAFVGLVREVAPWHRWGPRLVGN